MTYVEWLKATEAAAAIGVTPRTLYRFIDEGRIPSHRFGRVLRLKRAEVDEFVEAD